MSEGEREREREREREETCAWSAIITVKNLINSVGSAAKSLYCRFSQGSFHGLTSVISMATEKKCFACPLKFIFVIVPDKA